MIARRVVAWLSPCLAFGCSSSPDAPTHADAGIVLSDAPPDEPPLDSGKIEVDGGFLAKDGAVLADDRFATRVVSFTLGSCGGYGSSRMPGIVEGPPVGAGGSAGSLDVLSLGQGGEIVLSFEPNAIVDGPGADFIVFENAFYVSGDTKHLYAEPAEVSVSEDGATWKAFDCAATSYPFGSCAGWHPVYASPESGISPFEPAQAGGDPFDLADVGIAHAKYVRIRDRSVEPCPDAGHVNQDGFDLDAVAIVNGEAK